MFVKNTFTHDARVLREAQALAEMGIQVEIVCLQGTSLPNKEKISPGVNVTRVKNGPLKKIRGISDPSSSFSYTKDSIISSLRIRSIKLLRILSRTYVFNLYHKYIDIKLISKALELKPDILHVHDFDTLAAGVKVSKNLAIPLIYDSHELAPGRNLSSPSKNKKILNKEAKLIASAHTVIMASDGYARYAKIQFGIETPTVIYNVPNFVNEFDAEFDLRKLLQINIDDFLLVYQGNLQPNRGIESAIQSLVEVPNVSLVIIGYGDYQAVLIDLVKDLNLEARVHFYGPVPSGQLIHLAHSADAGLCNIVGASLSYELSMPNKLFEYLMSEIPIIVSNYEHMGQFVTRNKIGLVCEPEDPSSIAQAVSTLSGSQLVKQEYQNNCRSIKQEFSWENEKQKLVNVYSKFL
jgi:glycosyltransferase involved in cell wall biosynthesis